MNGALLSCGELVGHAYAWSPDGSTLAVVQEEAVTLLDGKTGQERQVLERGNPWGGVAWSPDGTHLAVCGRDNSLRIHDVKGRRLVRTVAGIPPHRPAARRRPGRWTAAPWPTVRAPMCST
ncbi:MAG: hypothetical protein U0736_09840 [Gemmataceae bacterium]